MTKRGLFIVFEGCDRSGKSTQASLLSSSLPNSTLLRFPNRTSNIGKVINSYLASGTELNDQAIHLLFSANRWESMADLVKLLESGQNIVCDRYAYSGAAFSAAKGLDLDWCKTCDGKYFGIYIVGLAKPDIVVFFDIEPRVAALRGEYGNERYENIQFQELVKSNYLLLRDETWRMVDASQGKAEVEKQVGDIVKLALETIALDGNVEMNLWK